MSTDDPFNRPIRPIGEEERDRLKVPNIQSIHDALDAEKQKQNDIREKKLGPFAAFVALFKKFLELMPIKKAEMTQTVMKDDILVKDLRKLKLLFEQMSIRNQSENINFAQELSDTWTSLFFHCEAIESGKMKSGIDPRKIYQLLLSIGKYPEDTEHNLGYYLKHHAGQDWLPFPFMELLRKLHRNFAVDGEKSHLHQWIQELNTIIPGKDS